MVVSCEQHAIFVGKNDLQLAKCIAWGLAIVKWLSLRKLTRNSVYIILLAFIYLNCLTTELVAKLK